MTPPDDTLFQHEPFMRGGGSFPPGSLMDADTDPMDISLLPPPPVRTSLKTKLKLASHSKASQMMRGYNNNDNALGHRHHRHGNFDDDAYLPDASFFYGMEDDMEGSGNASPSYGGGDTPTLSEGGVGAGGKHSHGVQKPTARKRRKKNAQQKCSAMGCCDEIKLTARNDGEHPLCEKHKRAAVARCSDGAEVCFCFYCNKAHGVEEFTHKTNICDRQYLRRRAAAAAAQKAVGPPCSTSTGKPPMSPPKKSSLKKNSALSAATTSTLAMAARRAAAAAGCSSHPSVAQVAAQAAVEAVFGVKPAEPSASVLDTFPKARKQSLKHHLSLHSASQRSGLSSGGITPKTPSNTVNGAAALDVYNEVSSMKGGMSCRKRVTLNDRCKMHYAAYEGDDDDY